MLLLLCASASVCAVEWSEGRKKLKFNKKRSDTRLINIKQMIIECGCFISDTFLPFSRYLHSFPFRTYYCSISVYSFSCFGSFSFRVFRHNTLYYSNLIITSGEPEREIKKKTSADCMNAKRKSNEDVEFVT